MTSAFKTLGIIGRIENPGVKETLLSLIAYLTQLQQSFLIETETAKSLNKHSYATVNREQLGERCDLVIVIGGDGSLLSTAHSITDFEIPLLGINRGSLGFLTDILPAELEKIKAILEGKYHQEERFMLSATIGQQQNHALNEVAIIPDLMPHMIEFEIYINEEFVCSQRSDGLIIATPTGSTAYALSGGGPILHPELDAIVLVPMFPHTLSSRPIVINGNDAIQILISSHNKTTPRVCCDGQKHLSAPPGSTIRITKKPQRLKLIHPVDYSYYDILRSKLHWGKKLQNSE